MRKVYSYGFLIPAAAVYGLFFLVPTVMSFFFAFTRWNLMEWEWVGFSNFQLFLNMRPLNIGFRNTLIYAGLTSGLKVVLGLLLGMFLCIPLKSRGFLRSMVFFPTLISTVAVGAAFANLMHPSQGLINVTLGQLGIVGPDWLGDFSLALYSVILVDVWRGLGIATVIYIAGIMAIPETYFEALAIDGGGRWAKFYYIILPLTRPAMNTVIILSLIGGLRSFDLIWTMTGGGPGFSSDVLASIIYKQYASGFYGLATAGNVLLFIGVAVLVMPLYFWLKKGELNG